MTLLGLRSSSQRHCSIYLMPTGKLRAGLARVAGVATVEVVEELRKLMTEQGLPTFSKAVGVALKEWLLLRRTRAINPGPGEGVPRPDDYRSGVINASSPALNPSDKEATGPRGLPPSGEGP